MPNPKGSVMNPSIARYLEGVELSYDQPSTLYERVMSRPAARDAYLNTTKGVLSSRMGHRDLPKLLEVLDESEIAYLFNEDATLARPVFSASGTFSAGFEQIVKHVARLTQPAERVPS